MNKVVFIIALLSLVSCNHSLKHKIHNYCLDSTKCELKLADITDFKWDKLYVFDYFQTDSLIDRVIGVHYSSKNYPFGAQKYIFLYKNDIVYADEVEYMVSVPTKDDDYIIKMPEHAVYMIFTPDNALFDLSHKYGAGSFVVLYFKHSKDHPFHFKNLDSDTLTLSDSLLVPCCIDSF